MDEIDEAQRAAWRDANRGFIARTYPIQRTRERFEQPAERDRWREACEMGWIAALVTPERGGLGTGLELFVDLAEEIGRGLVPAPFAGCALSSVVIDADPAIAGNAALDGLLDGSACAAWCGGESQAGGAGEPAGPVGMRLRPTGDGEVLDGCDPFVLHADAADVLLVSAQAAGEIRNVLVPAGAGGVRVTRARGFDLTRSICRVDFDGVAVPAAPPDWDAEAARQAARRGSELGALLVCADAIGSAQRLMEMTVAYAQSREVFGRALATYQAVKHACADMLCGLEGSREAALDAARRLQDAPGGLAADDATRSVHVAKSFAAAACSHIAGEALQLHGGIGFTWEHDLHLFLRRIKADEALFGTVAWHRDRLGRDAIAGALADG